LKNNACIHDCPICGHLHITGKNRRLTCSLKHVAMKFPYYIDKKLTLEDFT
jgi:hypothetical protein